MGINLSLRRSLGRSRALELRRPTTGAAPCPPSSRGTVANAVGRSRSATRSASTQPQVDDRPRSHTESARRRRPSTASPRPALTAGTPRTSNRGAAPTATSGGRRGWGEEGGPGGTTLGRSRLATRRAVRPRRGTGPRRLDVAGRPRLEAAPLRTPASNAHPGGGASRASSEGRLQSLRARGFRQRGGHTTRESQHEDRKRDQEREHAGASEREDLQRGAGGAFERIEVARALGVDAHGLLLRLGLGLRCRPLGLKLRRTHERPGRPARLYLPRRRRLPPERE